jgi:hypothetical protein
MRAEVELVRHTIPGFARKGAKFAKKTTGSAPSACWGRAPRR